MRDPRTFELLEHGFARDRVTGYYLHGEVTGSDGATFAVAGNHYAKDATRVYFADLVVGDGDRRPYVSSAPVPGAQGATFRVLDAGYAADAGQAYHRDQVLSRDVASFAVLAFDYAKNSTPRVLPGCGDSGCRRGDVRDLRRADRSGRCARRETHVCAGAACPGAMTPASLPATPRPHPNPLPLTRERERSPAAGSLAYDNAATRGHMEARADALERPSPASDGAPSKGGLA